MLIDFRDAIAVVDGHKVKLRFASTGHYCIPISEYVLYNDSPPTENIVSNIVLHVKSLEGLSKNTPLSIISRFSVVEKTPVPEKGFSKNTNNV